MIRISLPFRRVVPEIVVGSLKEHPVKIVEGVLEASNVSKVCGVVGGVLVEVHGPWPTTTEVTISRACHVAVAPINLGSGCFVHTDTASPILKPGVCETRSIARNDASEIVLK